MKRKLLSTVAAAALVFALAAPSPSAAQEAQLADSAAIGLAELGYDTDALTVITAEQAAQIENVLGSSDSDGQKIARIDVILGHPNDATVPAQLGVRQLQDSAAAGLARLGVDPSVVGNLTLDELAQVENVLNSTDSDEIKAGRIEQIVGASEAAAWDVGQLKDSVSADMARLGINTDEVAKLDLDELAMIEAVMGSSDPDTEKRARIEQILMQ